MPNVNSSPQSTWQTLAEFNLPSRPGANRLARDYLAATVQVLNLSVADLERLTKAVDEAVQNAIESNNRYQLDLPPFIRVRVSAKAVADHIADQKDAPIPDSGRPHLAAIVSEPEPARGWGFFLIERLVNDTQVTGEDRHHSIELFLYLE